MKLQTFIHPSSSHLLRRIDTEKDASFCCRCKGEDKLDAMREDWTSLHRPYMMLPRREKTMILERDIQKESTRPRQKNRKEGQEERQR